MKKDEDDSAEIVFTNSYLIVGVENLIIYGEFKDDMHITTFVGQDSDGLAPRTFDEMYPMRANSTNSTMNNNNNVTLQSNAENKTGTPLWSRTTIKTIELLPTSTSPPLIRNLPLATITEETERPAKLAPFASSGNLNELNLALSRSGSASSDGIKIQI